MSPESLSVEMGRRLLAERIVVVSGDLGGGAANLVAAQLLHLAEARDQQDINLYINCSGGDLSAMLTIYDAMQGLPCDVATWCIGSALSMSAALLAAGTKGKRHALAHAHLLIRQPRGQFDPRATDLAVQASEFARLRQAAVEILARHSGQSPEGIMADTERGLALSALEAVAYGLVDDIVEPRAVRYAGLTSARTSLGRF